MEQALRVQRVDARLEPHRIQLSRRKGWRLPPNTVKVARPSRWGNPYRVGERHPPPDRPDAEPVPIEDAAIAVDFYRRWVLAHRCEDLIRSELAGRNLACWCPLDQPCHADVLLQLANR